MLTYLKALVGLRIKNDKGQAMVEYGIIIALIAALVIAVLLLLGPQIVAAFQTVVDALP